MRMLSIHFSQMPIENNKPAKVTADSTTHFHLLSIFPLPDILRLVCVMDVSCVNFIAKRVIAITKCHCFFSLFFSYIYLISYFESVGAQLHASSLSSERANGMCSAHAFASEQFKYVVVLEREKMCLEFGWMPFVSSGIKKKTFIDDTQKKRQRIEH